MNFIEMFQLAQNGNESHMYEIILMYTPMLKRLARVKGGYDQDLYQDLVEELIYAIKKVNVDNFIPKQIGPQNEG